MDRRNRLLVAVACISAMIITVLGTGAGISRAARGGGTPHLTWAQFHALSPARQAAVQAPFVNAAGPLQTVGSKAMAGIYWGTALDIPGRKLDLYVTNPGGAGRLLAAARSLDPRLDLALISVRRAAYSAVTLDAAGTKLLAAAAAKRLPFPLYSVSQVDFGASLRLDVPSPAAARRLAGVPLASLGGRSVAQFAGVRLTFEGGTPVRLLYSRDNDISPFIAGDYLLGINSEGGAACSAGIPVEDSSGEDYLITANHCFYLGTEVYTKNGTTRVGYPDRYAAAIDAERIDTTNSNGQGSLAIEGNNNSGSGIIGYPIVGNTPGWSAGMEVCQNGISSYDDAGRVPCDITVQGTGQFYACPVPNGSCQTITEVKTQTDNGNWITQPGDSGALVFTIYQSSERQALGMVDGGQNCSGSPLSCYTMFFVPARTVYGDLGVHLSPHD